MRLVAAHFRRPGRRLAAGLLFAALAVHNLEEGLAYPVMRSEVARLAGHLWPALVPPQPAAFQEALGGLTLAMAGLLAWSAVTRDERAGWLVVRLTAAVLLVNVLAPHLPAAILLGGYAPGVATSLVFNLPLSIWILRRGRPPSP